MLPGAVTLIPLYIMYNKIGWLDTFYPLTVPAFFGGGAFNIFLLRQFFTTIPLELEEAVKQRLLWYLVPRLTSSKRCAKYSADLATPYAPD